MNGKDSVHVNEGEGEKKPNRNKWGKTGERLSSSWECVSYWQGHLEMQARGLPVAGANSTDHSHPCSRCSYDCCPLRCPGRRTRAKGPPLSPVTRCLPWGCRWAWSPACRERCSDPLGSWSGLRWPPGRRVVLECRPGGVGDGGGACTGPGDSPPERTPAWWTGPRVQRRRALKTWWPNREPAPASLTPANQIQVSHWRVS